MIQDVGFFEKEVKRVHHTLILALVVFALIVASSVIINTPSSRAFAGKVPIVALICYVVAEQRKHLLELQKENVLLKERVDKLETRIKA